MKKLALLIGLWIVCLVFSACDPSSYQFDYHDLADNVVRIELIHYDNPDQRQFISWVPDHSSHLMPFQSSRMTVLETLDDAKKSDFLKQLSEAYILDKYYVYNSPKGICIKLSYSNGDFLIITCNYAEKAFGGYIGRYSENGDVAEFIGSFSGYDSFESLVNDFFEIKI